ncbi:MAG TPA: hypothetical protein VK277_06190 [Acidimicrobiales bacterium]|nr:hypothetical protein [Acidimicrobiales bacterium]
MAGGAARQVDLDLLQRARDSLPGQLNAGILMGDGGFCVLGWMLYCAGFHEISLYANTVAVADPARGGPATDVVAAVFGLPVDDVVRLAQLNDEAPAAERHAAVARQLDELLAEARSQA